MSIIQPDSMQSTDVFFLTHIKHTSTFFLFRFADNFSASHIHSFQFYISKNLLGKSTKHTTQFCYSFNFQCDESEWMSLVADFRELPKTVRLFDHFLYAFILCFFATKLFDNNIFLVGFFSLFSIFFFEIWHDREFIVCDLFVSLCSVLVVLLFSLLYNQYVCSTNY